MISAIVTTHDSARHIVRCLAPLVAGVADGVIKEAIIADAGSRDETVAMAEEAGCRVVRGDNAAAIAVARADWLLLLPARAMLEAGWIEDVRRFIQRMPNSAACFTFAREDGGWADAFANMPAALLGAPLTDQGLLIARASYGRRKRVRLLRTRVVIAQ